MKASDTIARLHAAGLVHGSLHERELLLALASEVYEAKTAAGTMTDLSDFAAWLIELERAIKALGVKAENDKAEVIQ
jgi:tRNA A-37 threonylcarbamoyl transferase component Bud32